MTRSDGVDEVVPDGHILVHVGISDALHSLQRRQWEGPCRRGEAMRGRPRKRWIF